MLMAPQKLRIPGCSLGYHIYVYTHLYYIYILICIFFNQHQIDVVLQYVSVMEPVKFVSNMFPQCFIKQRPLVSSFRRCPIYLHFPSICWFRGPRWFEILRGPGPSKKR